MQIVRVKSSLNVWNWAWMGTLSCMVCTGSVLWAQPESQRSDNAPTDDADQNTTRVLDQEQIKPAFRIEPIVHRLEARRGQDLPFEFVIFSLGRPTTMTIKPVAITQRENGVIASDESAIAPTELRIEGPAQVELATGKTHTIKGRVRVPLVNSTFQSFGILVRDDGIVRNPEAQLPNAPDDQTRIGIRFVTQYLLRCDISVLGVRGERVKELQIQSAELVEDQGRAKLATYLVNPTNSPMACTVRCRIKNADTGTIKPPFSVGMITRAQQSPPEKYDIRILANTRLRLEELIPHPITTGNLELLTEILDDRRVEVSQQLALHADVLEFPAQNRLLVAVSDAVTASPGAVEVSLQKGGNRIGSVLLTNDSEGEVHLRLKAVDNAGEPVSWLNVRPEELKLLPGRNRNVMLSLAGNQELDNHQYGQLKIETVSANETLPPLAPVQIAFISRSPALPQLEFGELTWDTSAKTPAFVLPVKNTGGRHLPLNATLKLTSIDGGSMVVAGGFDRWLLPGQSDAVRFRFKEVPAPGQYQMELTIDRGPGQLPMVAQEVIEIAAP